MWTCSLLKNNAKSVLSRSYWKVFLVCAVAMLLMGNLDPQFGSGSGANQAMSGPLAQVPGDSGVLFSGMMGMLISLGLLLALLLIFIFTMVWSIFFGSVLEVGLCRYMIRNRSESPQFSTLFSAFSSQYWNVMSARLYANIRIFLYYLLLIVPGVIKSYEYWMVPYLLAENPQMAPSRAAELSSLITTGEKWHIFLLELSFLGWRILGALFFGLGNLFVEPYYQATRAELYAALRAKALAEGFTQEEELRPQNDF